MASTSILLIRNLQDVFGENDTARRRAAIDELWSEDGVFCDPKTDVHRGRDEIDGVAGAVRATHPNFQYRPQVRISVWRAECRECRLLRLPGGEVQAIA